MDTADPLWNTPEILAAAAAGRYGLLIRRAREAQRLTLAAAGATLGYSRSTMSRVELSKRHLNVTELRRFADMLRIPHALLGITPQRPGAIVAHSPAGYTAATVSTVATSEENDVRRRDLLLSAGAAIPLDLLDRLDRALALLPTPTARPSLPGIAARLEAARLRFDTGALARLVSDLPDLLSAAHDLAEHTGTEAAYSQVAGCYDLATHTLNKIGRYPASRLTADRATIYARLSGCPITAALSARALSIVLRHEGRPDLAQQINLDALCQVEATGLTTITQRTVFTQLLCSSSYAAAQAGDRDRALELTAQADRAVLSLPATPERPARPTDATTLTPAQVQLYKVGVFWQLGDAGSALHAGRDLHAGQFPTPERRGRLHTDMARAAWQWGKPERTAAELLAAHQHAPAEVLTRPAIRAIATSLIRQHPRATGVRRLATVCGVPA